MRTVSSQPAKCLCARHVPRYRFAYSAFQAVRTKSAYFILQKKSFDLLSTEVATVNRCWLVVVCGGGGAPAPLEDTGSNSDWILKSFTTLSSSSHNRAFESS